MKTLAKSLALVLSLNFVLSATSFAEAKPIVRPANVAAYKTAVYTTVAGKLSLAIDKQKGGTVDIRMKNAAGDVVYKEYIAKNERTFRAKLDVSQLPDGEYQIEITNGAETTVHAVKLSTERPSAPSRLVAVN